MINIITNKKIFNKSNGHSYRLISMTEISSSLRLFNLEDAGDMENKNKIIVDIPGVSFLQLLRLRKFGNIDYVFLQDSLGVFFLNKLVFLFTAENISFLFIKTLFLFVKYGINEFLICVFFKKIGLVSKSDYLFEKMFRNKYFLVENGINQECFGLYHKKPNSEFINFFFWGNLSYPPNFDSILFFLKKYWGGIKKEFPNALFNIYGVNNDKLKLIVQNYNGVILKGKFNNYSELLENDIFINLVEYGAGMKNKTLEAVACNIPMITTPHSIDGIDILKNYRYKYKNNKDLFFCINDILSSENFSYGQFIEDEISKFTWENSTSNYIKNILK